MVEIQYNYSKLGKTAKNFTNNKTVLKYQSNLFNSIMVLKIYF